jgi:hypothetical protein
VDRKMAGAALAHAALEVTKVKASKTVKRRSK